MSLFETLSKQSGPRTFSDDEIRNMSKEFRRYISTANGSIINRPPGWVEFLAGRELTHGDKEAAVRINSEVQIRVASHYRPESFLTTNGGTMHYTPETVSYVSLSGATQVRANAAIPTAFGKVEKYSNVQVVAAVAAQLVSATAGNWESNIPIMTWNKILPRDGGMDAAGMVAFAETVKTALNLSKNWKAMETTTRNSITGLEALNFIRNELDALSEDEYNLINTRLVFSILKPFERDDNQWYERIHDNDQPVISPVSFKKVTVSPACLQQIKKEGYPAAYWYLGGWSPSLQLPNNTGRLKEALDRYGKMMEVQNGNHSSTAILAGMRGYSGLNDEGGKRVQYFLACVMEGWRRNLAVDVQLVTVGDLVLLKSSLNKWVQHIRAIKKKNEMLEVKLLQGEYESVDDVRFILPRASDIANVHQRLKAECIFTPRQGTVIVVYNAGTLPTASEKGQAVDYVSAAKDMIPSIWRSNQLIAYIPIFDSIFFPVETTDDGGLNSSKSRAVLDMKLHVYQFGTASMFRGIVSTISGLNLVGFGYRKQEGKWLTKEAEALVPVPLESVDSFPNWLKRVGVDCAIQMVAWLRPISRYSPISNLPSVSKTGVTLILSSVQGEDGTLIGNISRIEGRSVRRGQKIEEDDSRKTSSVVTTTTTTTAITLTTTTTPPVSQRNRRKIVEEEPAPVEVEEEIPFDIFGADSIEAPPEEEMI